MAVTYLNQLKMLKYALRAKKNEIEKFQMTQNMTKERNKIRLNYLEITQKRFEKIIKRIKTEKKRKAILYPQKTCRLRVS